MCSRPLRPLGFPIYVARIHAAPFARFPAHSSLPSGLYLYLGNPFGLGRVPALSSLPLAVLHFMSRVRALHSWVPGFESLAVPSHPLQR